MKKLFFSLVAATMATTATFAQNTLVATLSHDENVTMYYGAYALRDAYNAAVSGDVINLSGGAFQSVDIKKALTLRGSGIDAQDPTIIVNDFTFDIPNTDTGRMSMEGIRCANMVSLKSTLTNALFLKCMFNQMQEYYSEKITAIFADCKVTGNFYLNGDCSIQFINSLVNNFENSSSYNSTASFLNCIVSPAYGQPYRIQKSQLKNCIIHSTDPDDWDSLPRSSVASNCVAIGYDYDDFFEDSPASTGCKTSSYAEMFKTFTGTYSDTETFELTDAAKTEILGTDGKEVGMYGGVLPYTSTPSYPQITKMNVANKTTADGKLSVEIEVSAAQ